MVRGLRITIQGEYVDFDYTAEDINNRHMDLICVSRGLGIFHLLEYWEVEDKIYVVYGWNNGLNYNSFELDTTNAMGDIIIYAMNDDSPLNIDMNEIEAHYTPIDLDNYLIEDELNVSSDDSYNLDEPWIVNDLDEPEELVRTEREVDSDDSFGSIDYN